MTTLTETALFAIGLAIGSFLNVLSLRYSGDSNIFLGANGRSHCVHCRTQLRWFELIPVFSFMVQRGRCRSCHRALSWQYPIVEIACGFIFLIPAFLFNAFDPLGYQIGLSVLWTAAFTLLLLVFVVDFRIFLIPDEINIVLACLGVAFIALQSHYGQFGNFFGSLLGPAASVFGLRESIWMNHVAAALSAMAFFGAVFLITRGRGMGLGDVKLAGALGLLMGWPDILFLIVIAFLIGSAVSLVLIAFRKKGFKDMVPFGPFLVTAAALIFFFGPQIASGFGQLQQWYASRFLM